MYIDDETQMLMISMISKSEKYGHDIGCKEGYDLAKWNMRRKFLEMYQKLGAFLSEHPEISEEEQQAYISNLIETMI